MINKHMSNPMSMDFLIMNDYDHSKGHTISNLIHRECVITLGFHLLVEVIHYLYARTILNSCNIVAQSSHDDLIAIQS